MISANQQTSLHPWEPFPWQTEASEDAQNPPEHPKVQLKLGNILYVHQKRACYHLKHNKSVTITTFRTFECTGKWSYYFPACLSTHLGTHKYRTTKVKKKKKIFVNS